MTNRDSGRILPIIMVCFVIGGVSAPFLALAHALFGAQYFPLMTGPEWFARLFLMMVGLIWAHRAYHPGGSRHVRPSELDMARQTETLK